MENDKENDSSPEAKRKKRRKTEKVERGDLADRAIKRLRANERRKKLKQEEELIQQYYQSGTYYGMSISNMIYTLASQLGRSCNDFLW